MTKEELFNSMPEKVQEIFKNSSIGNRGWDFSREFERHRSIGSSIDSFIPSQSVVDFNMKFYVNEKGIGDEQEWYAAMGLHLLTLSGCLDLLPKESVNLSKPIFAEKRKVVI